MTWYKAGTISVTHGSKIVDGVGVDFISNVKAGFCLRGPDFGVYEIGAIDSIMRLELAEPYRGDSGVAQAYGIWQTQGMVMELTRIAAELLNTFGAFRDAWEDGELVGVGLQLKDVLDSPDQLPEAGQIAGDAYLIGFEIYVWTGARWAHSSIRGEQGTQGEKGDVGNVGPPNQLRIGVVIRGTDAAAEITGESPNQALNLTLPIGDPGPKGDRGSLGYSAFEIAVQNGFVGSQEEWLASLKGYVLPVATAAKLGGVKAGDNITIDADGKISAQASTVGTVPFFLASGTASYIPLTADKKLPFTLANGTTSNIPLST